MSRARNYVFTLNNYTDEHVFALRACCDAGRARFLCFQGEIGANGTKHLQGAICFNEAVTLAAAKLRFAPGQPHLESMRGTIEQAIAYCSKEETRDPTLPYAEFGSKPPGECSYCLQLPVFTSVLIKVIPCGNLNLIRTRNKNRFRRNPRLA